MYYIVFDLEFNQDIPSIQTSGEKTNVSTDAFPLKGNIAESALDSACKFTCPYEIIQIGAIKLGPDFHTIDTFNRYVKPTIYTRINAFVTDLTGITADQLLFEETFPAVFENFLEFIGFDHPIFCIWGNSDMKELFRNAKYHKLDIMRIPDRFINLQPYVSALQGLPKSKLLKLQTAVEALNIRMPYHFHHALYDAYYTAEILKKTYHPLMKEKQYYPDAVTVRIRKPKKVTDYEKLILQFEKMYSRQLLKEERDMVILAYKMGKTHQFIK